MADQDTSQGAGTDGQGQSGGTEQPSGDFGKSDEVTKLKEEYEARIEGLKKSQAGSDRIVTELKRDLEELRKSQMGDKERIEYEKKLAEQERLNFERERKALELDKMKFKFIAEQKVDPRLEAFLTADTEDGLKKQIDTIKAIIAEAVKAKDDEWLSKAGKPAGGDGSTIDKLPPLDDVAGWSAIYKSQGKEAHDRLKAAARQTKQ